MLWLLQAFRDISEAWREEQSFTEPRGQPKTPPRNLQKIQQTMKHERESLFILLNEYSNFQNAYA